MAARRAKRKGQAPPPRTPLPAPGTVVRCEARHVERAWTTRVEWTEGAQMGVIAPLRPDGRPVPLEPGAELSVGWPTPLAYLEAVARLRGEGDDRIATWVLDVREVAHHQRRSAYRLDVAIPLTMQVGDRTLDGTARDLSEVGLRCVVPRADVPALDVTAELRFDLPDVGELAARGRVVRVEPVTPTEAAVGLTYVGLAADAAEALRRFVFEEQLRRRNTTG